MLSCFFTFSQTSLIESETSKKKFIKLYRQNMIISTKQNTRLIIQNKQTICNGFVKYS